MDYLIGIYFETGFYEYMFINPKGESLCGKIKKPIKSSLITYELIDEIGACIQADCNRFDKNGCKGIGLLGLNRETHTQEINRLELQFPNIQITVCNNAGPALCLAIGACMHQSVIVLPPDKLCMMTPPEESNGHAKYSYLEMIMTESIELDWMADMLFSDLYSSLDRYYKMDSECDNIPDGARGLYYEIDSSGERSFIGIQKFHSRGCFLKATYETWALFILDGIEKDAVFSQVREIIFTDGKWFLKNWLQTVANITGKTVIYQPVDPAFAAALYVGITLDITEKDLTASKKSKTYVFNPQEYTLNS